MSRVTLELPKPIVKIEIDEAALERNGYKKVINAHWNTDLSTDKIGNLHIRFICSACGRSVTDQFNYCPECGAVMTCPKKYI